MISEPPCNCKRCGTPLTAEVTTGICPQCVGKLGKMDWLREEEAPLTVTSFGDFEVGAEIARGGMGVVYQARQISLNRPVALKFIHRDRLASESLVKRFQQEAEAAANLDHPNIVPVYETGSHGGIPYICMKLIAGDDLANCEQRFSYRQTAQLMAKIARAVHYAHARGILHRDLKPNNILLDQEGEPYVTDFGLAKFLDTDAGLSRTAAIIGTPHFMSPEQCRGNHQDVSVTSDVFSLGILLHKLLLGRVPFKGDSTLAVMREIADPTPVKPLRNGANEIPRDLDTICRKSLHKDSDQRYPSALALAEDLERWLAAEPIQARPVGLVERTIKWVRRKPAIAALVTALVLALVTGLVGVLWQSRIASRMARDADIRLYDADALVTDQALRRHDFRKVWRQLERMRPYQGGKDLRGIEWRLIWKMSQSDELITLGEIPRSEDDMWNKARLHFTDEANVIFTGGASKRNFGNYVIESWRLDTQERRPLIHEMPKWEEASYSPAGVLLGLRHPELEVVNMSDPPEIRQLPLLPGTHFYDFHLSENGRRAALAIRREPPNSGSFFQVWDLSETPFRQIGEELFSGYQGYYPERKARLSSDGVLLGTAEPDGVVQVRLADPPHDVVIIDQSNARATAMAFSPDSQWFACARYRGPLELWNLRTREGPIELGTPNDVALAGEGAFNSNSLMFSPDGKTLWAGRDQAIKGWRYDERSGRWDLVATMRGHRGDVTAVAVSPSGNKLVSAGSDGKLRVFPTRSDGSQRRVRVSLPSAPWESGDFSPDGTKYVFVSNEGIVTLVDVNKLTIIDKFEESLGDRNLMAIFAGSNNLLAVGHQMGLRIFDLTTQSLVSETNLESVENPAIWPVKILDKHQLLVTTTPGRRARLWDMGTWERVDTGDLVLSDGTYWDVTADESYYVQADHASKIKQLPIASDGRFLMKEHKVAQTSVAMGRTADGRQLGIAHSAEGTLLWDVTDADSPRVLHRNIRMSDAAAFSPNARRVATDEEGLTIWNVETGLPLLRLQTEAWVSRIKFSPDGNAIAAGCGGKYMNGFWVHLWRAPTWEEIEGAETNQDIDRTPSPKVEPRSEVTIVDPLNSSRSATVHIPASYRDRQPMPLVIAFHGLAPDPTYLEDYFNLKPLAERKGFLLIHLTGTRTTFKDHIGWNDGLPVADASVDDVGFIRRMILETIKGLNVDTKRIVLYGHSNGGSIAYRVARYHGEMIAAVASLEGLPKVIPNEPDPKVPVHVLHIHSSNPSRRPLPNDAGLLAGTTVYGVEDVMKEWGKVAGHRNLLRDTNNTLDLQTNLAGKDTTVTRMSGGFPKIRVEFWEIENGRHVDKHHRDFTEQVIDWLLVYPRAH